MVASAACYSRLACKAAQQRPRSSAPQRRSGGLPMRQQRGAAEHRALPGHGQSHPPQAQARQHADQKAEAVWQRFKGQPHPAPQEPGKAEVLSVAEAIVLAGPNAASAAAIIRAEPAVLLADPRSITAKMLSAGAVAKDAVKSRQALHRKLGTVAAHAAVLDLSDAAFDGSCQLLSELLAAARPNNARFSNGFPTTHTPPPHPHNDKVWEVLQFCDTARLSALLCDHSAGELRHVAAALRQSLGWSAAQAAAALLEYTGSTHAPSACPHRRLKQLAAASPEGVAALGSLLRARVHDDTRIAWLTLSARVDWAGAALSAAGIKAALHACHKATGLPEQHAAVAWLAGFAEPPLLGLARQLVQAGAEPELVERLAVMWMQLADQGGGAGELVQRVASLRWQLGNWQAAVLQVVKEGSL